MATAASLLEAALALLFAVQTLPSLPASHPLASMVFSIKEQAIKLSYSAIEQAAQKTSEQELVAFGITVTEEGITPAPISTPTAPEPVAPSPIVIYVPVPTPTLSVTKPEPVISKNLSANPLGETINREKKTRDILGKIYFSEDFTKPPSAINKITVTFSGSAISRAIFGVVDLLDQNGNSVMNTSGVTSSTISVNNFCTATSTCVKTWYLGEGISGWIFGNGQGARNPDNFSITIDSRILSGSLKISINEPRDIEYTEDTSGKNSKPGIFGEFLPLTINEVVYSLN